MPTCTNKLKNYIWRRVFLRRTINRRMSLSILILPKKLKKLDAINSACVAVVKNTKNATEPKNSLFPKKRKRTRRTRNEFWCVMQIVQFCFFFCLKQTKTQNNKNLALRWIVLIVVKTTFLVVNGASCGFLMLLLLLSKWSFLFSPLWDWVRLVSSLGTKSLPKERTEKIISHKSTT